jgi:FAD/FMN-containing dehydrogenase
MFQKYQEVPVEITAPAIDTLSRDFGGDLIEPGAAEYEAARRSLFAVGSPAVVLRPAGVRDVQAGVRFAARSGLPLSVRGGGHGFPGFGTNEGGVVLDLRDLADVEVLDHREHRVRIGGGATWGQVASALAPHGLAISSGDTKSVGVGGLTLSGGIGWKVRKYGLALDSLLGADLVVGDGDVVRADARENPELFWALRGGGGNVGVVTAFDFAAHPTTEVFFGTITFPAPEAAGVLRGWADHLRAAPDELTSVVTLANPATGGHEAPVEVHVVVDGDDASLAADVLAPLRRLGTVLGDDVHLTAYADTLQDGAVPPDGLRFDIRSAFVHEDEVPQVLRVLAESATTWGSPFISLRSVSGAVSRVPVESTAYAHRRAELMVMTLAAGPPPVIEAGAPARAALWRRLAPHADGAYANFLSSATEADVAAVYPPETAERLAAVKRRYDPRNLFDRNHNVRPAGAGRNTRIGTDDEDLP